MTYGAAWVSGSAAYLIADTLVTGERPALGDRTSLNQTQRRVGDEFVEERLLKLSHIRPGVACTFAGDVSRAREMVSFLREHARLYESPTDLLDALSNSFGPPTLDRAVELLLAWSVDEQPPGVFRWDSWTGHVERGPLLHVGSLREPHRTHNARSLARAADLLTETPTVMLATAIALMQAYCCHDDLIAQNIGGSACGLFVRHGATTWQSDMASVLLAGGVHSGYIVALMRDEVLAVDSNYLDGLVLFSPFEGNDRVAEAQRWLERWHTTVSGYAHVGIADCRHWVFINLAQRVLTIFVSHIPLNEHAGYFEVDTKGDEVRFYFGSKLGDLVFRSPTAEHRHGPGFDFRVIQGDLKR